MKESIKKPWENKEYFTAEQCYITELSNTPDDPAVSIRRREWRPELQHAGTAWKELPSAISLSAEKGLWR